MRKRRSKEQGNKCSIKTLLVSSAHGILMCTILLGAVSWAWFSESVGVTDIKMQSAAYGIQADVIDVSGNEIPRSKVYKSVTDGDYAGMELKGGSLYDVTLTGLGTATWNGGYCAVSVGDEVRYTRRIYPKDLGRANDTLSFRLWLNEKEDVTVKFLPYWGYYPETILEEVGTDEKIQEEYLLENNGSYVISGGDFIVSGGDGTKVTAK